MKKKALVILLIFVITFGYSSETSTIQVVSESGIAIFLDGIYKGVTTSEMGGIILHQLPSGMHTIKAAKKGFAPQEMKLTLKPEEIYTHTVQPFVMKITVTEKENIEKVQLGRLKIESTPIVLSIDIPALNLVLNKTKDEWIAENIPTGKYDVIFSSGNETMQSVIEINPGWLSHYYVDMSIRKIEEKNIYISPEQRMANIEMIEIPATPQRPKGSYIGKYELTQTLYKSIMGNNPSYFQGENLPVEQISWYDAVTFCNKLSDLCELDKVYFQSAPGKIQRHFGANGFRFPTKKEWEYAASGGGNINFWSGTANAQKLIMFAWYSKNSEITTHPVGTKLPNALGFYDMSGNVYEWTSDLFKTEEHGLLRISKGGSWNSDRKNCRIYSRRLYIDNMSHKEKDLGFRLARNKE